MPAGSVHTAAHGANVKDGLQRELDRVAQSQTFGCGTEEGARCGSFMSSSRCQFALSLQEYPSVRAQLPLLGGSSLFHFRLLSFGTHGLASALGGSLKVSAAGGPLMALPARRATTLASFAQSTSGAVVADGVAELGRGSSGGVTGTWGSGGVTTAGLVGAVLARAVSGNGASTGVTGTGMSIHRLTICNRGCSWGRSSGDRNPTTSSHSSRQCRAMTASAMRRRMGPDHAGRQAEPSPNEAEVRRVFTVLRYVVY